ncbi:hypothetical protein GCM10010470_30690 [Saccharopolyspora taberi]|uniref:Uncharacterized protein n=1 Tax=Saccharopolyspora taberi TaxID=60895 RepID=A0ABN3VDW4_9PSEU
MRPLHDELGSLKQELATRTTTASAVQQQLDALREHLRHAVWHAALDDATRADLQAALDG